MSSKISNVLSSLFFLALFGCAGMQLTKESLSEFTFEAATKEKIIEKLGPPYARKIIIKNGQRIDSIFYIYSNPHYESDFPEVNPVRTVSFSFAGSRVVSRERESSFKSDSTFFDTEKVKLITNGMSKKRLFEILPNPSGEYFYPMTNKSNYVGLAYLYSQTKGGTFSSPTMIDSSLCVELDEKNVIQEIQFIKQIVGQTTESNF